MLVPHNVFTLLVCYIHLHNGGIEQSVPLNPALHCTLKLNSNLALLFTPTYVVGDVKPRLTASGVSMKMSSTGSLGLISSSSTSVTKT